MSPTLNSPTAGIVINAEPVSVSTKLWNVAGAVFKPVGENELVTSEWKGGLRVTHLRENGPAEEAMIRIGDIVIEVDGEPMTETRGQRLILEVSIRDVHHLADSMLSPFEKQNSSR